MSIYFILFAYKIYHVTHFPKGICGREEVHEELKFVLTMFREKKLSIINDTKDIQLNQHSSSKEVQDWLITKGFSDKYIKLQIHIIPHHKSCETR